MTDVQDCPWVKTESDLREDLAGFGMQHLYWLQRNILTDLAGLVFRVALILETDERSSCLRERTDLRNALLEVARDFLHWFETHDERAYFVTRLWDYVNEVEAGRFWTARGEDSANVKRLVIAKATAEEQKLHRDPFQEMRLSRWYASLDHTVEESLNCIWWFNRIQNVFAPIMKVDEWTDMESKSVARERCFALFQDGKYRESVSVLSRELGERTLAPCVRTALAKFESSELQTA